MTKQNIFWIGLNPDCTSGDCYVYNAYPYLIKTYRAETIDTTIQELVSALKVCVVGNGTYKTMSQADKDLYDNAIKLAKNHLQDNQNDQHSQQQQ